MGSRSILTINCSAHGCLYLIAFLVSCLIPRLYAASWLAQDYTTYATGDYLSTSNTPSLITSVPSNNVIVNVNGNNKVRYSKNVASGNGTLYKLSENFLTDRPQGYYSFKITQNTTSGNTYLAYQLGANDSNTMASSASAYIIMRFYANSSTQNLKIYAGNGTSSPTQVYPTSGYAQIPLTENSFQVWYNKTANTLSYTDPNGQTQTLNANSFVVWINGVVCGSVSSTGTMPTSVITTTGVTSTTIGKLGWWIGAAANTVDYTFDDVYAGDTPPNIGTPPTVTSSANANAYLNVPFSYPITTDPSGATSFALTGTLPTGLSLNTQTGLISGTPTVVGGPTSVTLTASNSFGVGPAFTFTLNVLDPFNVFSGSNASLDTNPSWSYGFAPNSTTSLGSYADVSLSASVTGLETVSDALYAKSWNVSNGKSYSLQSAKTGGSTSFKMGATSPSASTFKNNISGVDNDLVFLTGNSSLTFSPINTANPANPSSVQLLNRGNFNIASGSLLNIEAVISSSSSSFGLTKTGLGDLLLSGANTYGSSTVGMTLSAGTLTISGSSAPTRLAQVKAIVSGGSVTGFQVIDGGAGYTVAPAVSLTKSTGDSGSGATATADISGGVVTAVNLVNAGSNYTIPPKVYLYSMQSPLGVGPVTLAGGTLKAKVDADLSRITTYSDGANAYFRLSGFDVQINGPVTLDVEAGKTLSCYTVKGNNNQGNQVTKTGLGTLLLRGSAGTGVNGDWVINEGTLFVNTSSSSSLGSGNSIVLNGGSLWFSKGISGSGNYAGQGFDASLQVRQNGWITLDPNPATLPYNNTVSFPNATISGQTLSIVKGSATKSSATDVGYTDPQFIMKTATLSGQSTFDVAENVEAVLQAGTGTGGVTKIGLGKLTLSDNNSLYAATATATLVGDQVTSISVTFNGDPVHPYATAPLVVLSPPFSGTTATATATITDGFVTSVNIVNPGSGYTSVPSVTIVGPVNTPNAYSGETIINTGTLGLSGSHASPITIGAGAVLETALVTSRTPETSGSLAFQTGAKVRTVGVPTENSYTLVTAAGGISGLPTLELPISGYSLAVVGNALKLQASGGSTYDSFYPVGSETTLGANGLSNLMNYALGQNGPNAPLPESPAMSSTGSIITLSFPTARSDDASLRFFGQWTSDLSANDWEQPGHSTELTPPALYYSQSIDTNGPRKFIRFKITR